MRWSPGSNTKKASFASRNRLRANSTWRSRFMDDPSRRGFEALDDAVKVMGLDGWQTRKP